VKLETFHAKRSLYTWRTCGYHNTT